jgi:predicted transglutaminase-like cysteine proteinase
VLFASQWRAAARIVAVVGLVASCGGGVTARSAPERAAALSALNAVWQSNVPSPADGPFGLSDAKDSPLAARWRSMQGAIALETRILSACEDNPLVCPPAAARFLAVVHAARERDGRARIGEVNRAVNLAVRPASDPAQYGLSDLWATPLMTFASGAGDCEDYAIAKHVALRHAGMAESDLRIVILHNRQIHQDHAVAAARVDGQWFILDNRTMLVLTDADVPHMTPLLALDSGRDDPPPLLLAKTQQMPGVASRN